MKLAQLILPKQDNTGYNLSWQHAALQGDLRKAFGGYTWHEGHGSWLDGEGKTVNDEVVIYQVAMDRAAVIRLRELAAMYAEHCRQECVMIVTPCGDVEFVKPENTY